MRPPDPADRRLEPYARRIDKPWGWETLWAVTPQYCGKILHIKAGRRLSLQYHDQKTETQCLIRGRALLIIEDADGALREIEMEPGKGYTILPFQRHRLVGIEDADVVEVSTPETGTTYRLEDDYARPHETETVRRQERSPSPPPPT
jgi:mannose-6-phosphate isomerase